METVIDDVTIAINPDGALSSAEELAVDKPNELGRPRQSARRASKRRAASASAAGVAGAARGRGPARR
jgi:hypothetical protein